MVKKLRYKFVTVTMALMTVVFGALFFVDYLYGQYWSEIDTLQILEWFADAEVFRGEAYETMAQPESENGNPIYFAMLDNNGEVKAIKGTGEKGLPEEALKAIASNPPEQWKWRSYIYITREYENGWKEIYVTDMDGQPLSPKKVMGTIALIGGGFLLLLGVSFYLSKYVVEPARKALEREKQFISDASHELKTPVAAISINAQALMGQMESNRHLKYILAESQRMDRLIRKLLTLSFLDGQGKNTPKRMFSLSECCEEAALTMESMAYEKKVSFDYEIESFVLFYGNEDEIKQLVAILLDNAMKHTREKGEIRFKLARKKEHPVIQVYNTGCGISREDLPHIFERFYSTEKSRTEKTDSFGLGLAIAKAIVEDHGGEIFAQSEYGSFANFSVVL